MEYNIDQARKHCQFLYENRSIQAIYDYGDFLGLDYSFCPGCEAETPTLEGKSVEECAVCGGSKKLDTVTRISRAIMGVTKKLPTKEDAIWALELHEAGDGGNTVGFKYLEKVDPEASKNISHDHHTFIGDAIINMGRMLKYDSYE
jgi:hypothetical protein